MTADRSDNHSADKEESLLVEGKDYYIENGLYGEWRRTQPRLRIESTSKPTASGARPATTSRSPSSTSASFRSWTATTATDRESDPKKLQEAVKHVIHIYDDVIVPSLLEFQDMLVGRFMPYDLRCKYIYQHSVGEQAIAKAIRACQDQFGAKWEDAVKQAFPKIDWRLVNPEWEGSAVQGGSIYTRRQNVEHTATFLKLKLGVPIPQVEADSLKAAIEATDSTREGVRRFV